MCIRDSLKADTQGSLEVLEKILAKIEGKEASMEGGFKTLGVRVIKRGIGEVTDLDVKFADEEDAEIFAFRVFATEPAKSLSFSLRKKIHFFETIYEMIEKTRKVNPNLKICATRKTVPGLAKYDKYAVTVGGGDTHRFNLSDMVLLKENHLSLFSSISEAITKAKETVSFSKKIEVEVKNEEEAIEAAKAGADIIMLDNFKPIQAKHVVKKIREINQNVLIELSGNIKIENIEDYELENVNHISSGSLTHSVKNFDLSMLIE
mgnify:CR=1 FL=1